MKVLSVGLTLWLPVLALATSQIPDRPAEGDPDEAGARFTNQWVVHVDGTVSDARAVARQHGFEYMRQVPGFHGHHLMRRREKIVQFHSGHHRRLRRSSKVMWAQQEQVKVRKKRAVRFNDKMYPQQWYLRKGALNGYDMNVRAAWDLGYTGKGVVVTILDDGLDYSHPDLKQNYDPKASYDVNDHDRDPMPRTTFDNENKHGTRCAGEVASTANNNLCNVGVAFKSKIGGVRMLDGDITDSVEGASLGLNQNYIDIYSGSWGPDDNGKVVDGPGVMARSAFERGVRSGRRGLGNIFIWASGNGGSAQDSCACDGYAGSIYTLSVSSVSEKNKKPWYLEECASTLASTYSSGYAGDRQVITTDLHHQCTDKHTGTSASAPMAAGIIALVLEANRNLTWRDVQYLTVITADPRPFRDASWITNGVGRKVSLLYGYGLMDAGKMVYLASLWRRVPSHRLCDTGSVQFFKPIYGKTTVTASFHTNGCASSGKAAGSVVFVEQVLLYLNLTFTRRGELRIALVSPAGTRSVLLPPRALDTASGNTKFDRWPLASAQFWGERAAGEWRLEVENTGATHNAGRLSSGKLMLYGVDSPPVRLRKPTKAAPDWFLKDFAKLVVPGGDFEESKTRDADGQLLCHPECRNRTACSGPGPGQCNGPCRNFKMAASGACVSGCPLGSFPATGSSRICQACHLRCESCAGPGPHNCTTCPIGSNLVQAQKRCLEVGQNCPKATFLAGTVCWPCPQKCTACANSERCLGCRQDNGTLVLAPNGMCVRHCPKQHFVSPDKRCLPCQPSCAACISARPDGCISCPNDRLLLKTNRSAAVGHCVITCPSGFYRVQGNSECLRCHFTCAACHNQEPTSCSSCRPGLVFNAGSCFDPVTIKCKTGHFARAAHCVPCHKSCAQCAGQGESNCLECVQKNAVLIDGRCQPQCPEGMFNASAGSDLHVCRPCETFCSSCSASVVGHCSRCRAGSQIFPKAAKEGSCRSKCEQGFFHNGAACKPCPSRCSECRDSSTCLRCFNGSLLMNDTCLPSCPDGHGAEHGRCGKCPVAHCLSCSGAGLTKCLACQAPLMLDASGKCSKGPLCPLGEFRLKEKCFKCHSECRSCSGPSASNCLSCPLNSCLASAGSCRLCCFASPSFSSAPCANCSLSPDASCLDDLSGSSLDSSNSAKHLTPLARLLIAIFVALLLLSYLLVLGVIKLRRVCCQRGPRYDLLPQNASGSPDRSNLEIADEEEEEKEKKEEEEGDSLGWTVTIDKDMVSVRWPNGYALPVTAGDKNSDVSSGVGSSPDKSTDDAANDSPSNEV